VNSRLNLPKLALVDLDGTLVDTLPDITFCVDGMLAECGLPAVGEARVREWVGNGTEALVRRALAGDMEKDSDGERYARALPIFMRLYEKHTSDRSRVYDGAFEALDFLRSTGVVLACVTNKASVFTQKLLADLHLDEYFALVISGDTLAQKKPDPLPLLHAARHFGTAPGDTLLIGDSANDINAARAAGMRVVCVSYGYNHGNDIRASHPDALVDSLAEIPDLFALSPRTHTAR
jgi:phosphoglycolate phosphatase